MNILLITQLFPADEAARYSSGALREFAVEWEKAGHRVQVFRPHFVYEQEPFREEPFEVGQHIRVEFIRPKRLPLLKWTFYNSSRLRKKLLFKPDVVICHLYNAYFTFSGLAKKLKVPFVAGIHMSDIHIAKNSFHRLHQRMVFAGVDAFACRSEAYQKQFREIFPAFADKTFLAQSGIPAAYVTMKRKKSASATIRIITVSRLTKRKQIDRVIGALKALPAGTDWTCTVVGEGAEESRLKQLAGQLDISGRVRFTGALPREQVMACLHEHDVFILPSYQETFGLVYLEAMASGCLVIGSKDEGIDGIICDGGNGFLCDARDQQSIQAKLLEAISLKGERRMEMLEAGYRTAETFTSESKAREYLSHLKRIVYDHH